MTSSIFQLILIVYLIIPNNSLVAYDCNSPKSKLTELSLVDAAHCSPDIKNITTSEKIIQLIQPLVFQEIDYLQCLIEIEHLTFRCGKSIDTMANSALQEELYDITKEECKLLIKEGLLNYRGLKIYINKQLNLNFISLETIGSIYQGSCIPGAPSTINGIFYDRPIRSSKFRILTKVGKGTIDLEESKLITEEGIRCNYQDENCFTSSGGSTFWEPVFTSQYCPEDKYIPIYQGQATEVKEVYKGKETTSFILHYDKYDFQVILTGKKTITCGQVSYLTEHPKLSVVVKDDSLPFVLSYNKKELGKNVNMMTYLNTKLVYTVKHVKDQIENLYEKLMYSRCLAENKLIHSILSSASTAPHEFAYQHINQEGFTATVRGEVVYIMQCEPVSVNFTTNTNNECYNELPVIYKNQLMFVSPRSRLISNIGTKIECSNIMPVKYKLLDSWYVSSPGGLIPTSQPSIMQMNLAPEWEFQEMGNLAIAGIYSQEDLDKIDKIILTSVRSDAIKAQLTRAIVGEGKLSENLRITNLMTPEDISNFTKSKLNSIMDQLYTRLGKFGNIVSTIIGIIIIIKSFLFILNSILSFKLLKSIFGLSWKLLFCWWDHVVNILIHKNQDSDFLKKKEEKYKKSISYNNSQLHNNELHLSRLVLRNDDPESQEFELE